VLLVVAKSWGWNEVDRSTDGTLAQRKNVPTS
jgi:hypothetical protein